MSTRDDIHKKVVDLKTQIAWAMDDTDLKQDVRHDLGQLWQRIDSALNQFNRVTGPDPFTDGGPTVEELFEAQFGDGGPTPDDLKGTVTHDIG